MNNFTFGLPDGSGKQYYETIAGGSGATNGHHGASAVQVHMTNTRITDPEVLEQRFPDIRIEKFAIRKNSGGDGKWIGGDGVERAIRFLKTMKVSLLTERRVFPPYGMKYGNPGKIGKNILIQEDGQEIKMDGTEEQTINPGEKIVIKTPGGGGYGKRT
jgi:5-oxoprolinase (ATP-hydrolysing)